MSFKQELKNLGEDTIYSAKGHFKANDVLRIRTMTLLFLCVILDIVGILDLREWGRYLNVIGAILTIMLIIWEAQDGKNQREKHKEYAGKYLAIHKDIRSAYLNDDLTFEQYELLRQKVNELDTSSKPDIALIPRYWAKIAIENWGETNIWWKS